MSAAPAYFELPIALDLVACFFCAATGALAALQKRYDLVGIVVLALVTGLGGALLRDGIFLQGGPPAVIQDGRYLVSILAGAALAAFFARQLHRLRTPFVVADAIALGFYSVVGAQKTLAAGLPPLTAALVGVVNAVGGGILRDVLVREEPLLFRPSELYAIASAAGCALFLLLTVWVRASSTLAASVGIGVTIAVRLLSIRLGWRTGALWSADERKG